MKTWRGLQTYLQVSGTACARARLINPALQQHLMLINPALQQHLILRRDREGVAPFGRFGRALQAPLQFAAPASLARLDKLKLIPQSACLPGDSPAIWSPFAPA